MTHNLNANLVHKWIRGHEQKTLTLQATFIPVSASPPIYNCTAWSYGYIFLSTHPHSTTAKIASTFQIAQILVGFF
ncbi:hypothetical protein [Pseudomonas kilonensis]|uniref:hypothetical protein n=1 Tax=Pseudomonas kilonensis TaxID=132476 RepID=UPI0004140A55|nr:hypothetical protein [Pseudomonas kilonensis]